jgi:4-hydroxy-tetrahydrodipicolinate reductase
MKIAIVGYGRMGHEIEKIAKERGDETITIDPKAKADFKEINEESMKGVDVAIDFSHHKTALENAKKCNDLKVNLVMGTTGWFDHMKKMENTVKDIGFIWSGNFSIGVNIFFRIIDCATGIINRVDEYDIAAFELHHKGKKDSPSGTAKMLGNIMLKNIERKKEIIHETLNRQRGDHEIHFTSVRGGSIPGTHTIMFDSDEDTIELIHRARGRAGFARGAVMAAEWIKGKKGFYNIDDFMNQLVK